MLDTWAQIIAIIVLIISAIIMLGIYSYYLEKEYKMMKKEHDKTILLLNLALNDRHKAKILTNEEWNNIKGDM